MTHRHPLAAIVVAMVGAVGLMTAVGCGSDASQAGDAVESVATSATGAAPSPDDSSAAPTESTGAATAPDSGGTAPAAQSIEIPADEQQLKFQKEEVTAKAGTITLSMPNPSSIPHNIAVDEPEKAAGPVVTEGGVSEITVDFPAGEYEYYCAVPGHKQAGMVGTLTVE